MLKFHIFIGFFKGSISNLLNNLDVFSFKFASIWFNFFLFLMTSTGLLCSTFFSPQTAYLFCTDITVIFLSLPLFLHPLFPSQFSEDRIPLLTGNRRCREIWGRKISIPLKLDFPPCLYAYGLFVLDVWVPQNSSIEALIPSVAVFGNGASRKVTS